MYNLNVNMNPSVENALDFDPDTLYLESIPQPQATAI
jgi:hypothetical protein